MDTRAFARAIVDTHHAALRESIHDMGERIRASGQGRRLVAPWEHMERALSVHFAREDEFYDRYTREAAPDRGEVLTALDQMGSDHDEIRTFELALRAAARDAGPLSDDLLILMDELSEHLEDEEETLFPALREQPLEAPAAEASTAEASTAEAPAEEAPAASTDGHRETVLRVTKGVCHDCLEEVPGYIIREGGAVRLEKRCPDHGVSQQLLSNSADYWAPLDRYYFQVNSEDYPQRDFIVRMTENCNLDCPICLAKANTEQTQDLDLSGLEELLTARRGIKVDLMAAEPTLREDLEDWIRKVKASGNIAALHTNGLKLANMDYAKRIAAAGVDEVFLQFDGFDDDANEILRGRKLLRARMMALSNMRALDVAVSLIVVIARGVNEQEIWRTFRFALRPDNRHIREVFFLGLRMLGSARDSSKREDATPFEEMTLMPDELLGLLCEQEPRITRQHVQSFNKLYFAMLSAFKVKKCLYVQHYMVSREPGGGFTPFSDLVDLPSLDKAADNYARLHGVWPGLARARLLADVARYSANRRTAEMIPDFFRLQRLFQEGMNLARVPDRFLMLGFITACDPYNFDAQVAINCGKGELSVDGGFTESGAVANVSREARFEASGRAPGEKKRERRAARRDARGHAPATD